MHLLLSLSLLREAQMRARGLYPARAPSIYPAAGSPALGRVGGRARGSGGGLSQVLGVHLPKVSVHLPDAAGWACFLLRGTPSVLPARSSGSTSRRLVSTS